MRTVTMVALDGRKSGVVQFDGKEYEFQPDGKIEVDVRAAPSLLGAGFMFYIPSAGIGASAWDDDPGDLSGIFSSS